MHKCSTIIQKIPPGGIRHPGGFCIGQVSNVGIVHMTSLLRKANAIASARFETPSLDRILLT